MHLVTFEKIWMKQGLINSKGHSPCARSPKEGKFETRRNSFADETAKLAALTSEAPVFCLIPHLPAPHITPIFTPSEEEQLKKLGAVRTEQGKWVLPGGREMISKPLMRELLTYLYQGSHRGSQAMCEAVL
jgi:hypothetical protein